MSMKTLLAGLGLAAIGMGAVTADAASTGLKFKASVNGTILFVR